MGSNGERTNLGRVRGSQCLKDCKPVSIFQHPQLLLTITDHSLPQAIPHTNSPPKSMGMSLAKTTMKIAPIMKSMPPIYVLREPYLYWQKPFICEA